MQPRITLGEKQPRELTKIDLKPLATPGVVSMIALKLHATRQPSRDHVEKDWSDVLALVKAHQLSLDDPDFSATVLKHGGETAIKRIQASILGGLSPTTPSPTPATGPPARSKPTGAAKPIPPSNSTPLRASSTSSALSAAATSPSPPMRPPSTTTKPLGSTTTGIKWNERNTPT